jgi:hypothetical protein
MIEWTEMQRADFDREAPLVLFEAPGTRKTRKQAQAVVTGPDLFSLDEPADE